MWLTFEPSSQSPTRIPTNLHADNRTLYSCTFDLTILAHGGSPGDAIVLAYMTSDLQFLGHPPQSRSANPDMAGLFGSAQLKYGESLVAHVTWYQLDPFTLRLPLTYIGPDLATKSETFTGTCQ